MRELTNRLLQDIREVGITVDFDLELRDYSKTYFGRYDPNTNKITVYVYEDSKCSRAVPYRDLLMTTIHEAVHCIQWDNPNFVRRKGVMHDAEFYRLLGMYSHRAEHLLRRKECSYDKFPEAPRRKISKVPRGHLM